jgi:hypothetical protein
MRPGHVTAAADVQRIFSWSVITEAGDPPKLGALGVSDNKPRAIAELTAALRSAPAAPS